MKSASLPGRHRRLLAVGVASLLLHLLAIEWLSTRYPSAPPDAPAARVMIVARLSTARPAAAPAQPPAPAAHAAHAAGTARPAPSPAPAPSALPAPVESHAAAAQAAAPVRGAESVEPPDEPVQMPGRYRVRMPPAVDLSYAVTRSVPGQPPAAGGEAHIAWKTNGDTYSMRIDGLPDAQGGTRSLSSEGGVNDSGIAPLKASETRADGATALTRFDAEARRILFGGSARSYPFGAGTQDRASILMQLSGMGLAEPDQIKDEIAIYVGGAANAGVVKFEVVGQEQVASPLGAISAWHLMQAARPGEPRFEVWLAPAHNWNPVQLRTTAPDGSASTALVTRIDTTP